MSAQVAMMLGDFAFESLGFGFDNTTKKTNTPWVDVAVAQSRNKQQWTGPTSEDVVIKGVLFPEELGGQNQLDGIVKQANTGVVMMLVSGDTGNGVIHGEYTVQSVDEDGTFHTAAAAPRRNAYSINLKKYGD